MKICLVNLLCPNGHPVEGWPVKWKHDTRPPESWLDYQGRRFMRVLKKNPPRPCATCGATFNPNSNDRKHLEKWAIQIGEMKAPTMRAARNDLKKCAEILTVKE